MKKVLTIVLAFSVVLLAGCTSSETTELEQRIADLEAIIVELESTDETQETNVTEMSETLEELQIRLDASNVVITELQEQNVLLEEQMNTTNSRIKNALDRENWAVRKVEYNADWTMFDAEYCLGVFEEDWTTLPSDDYKVGEGLKFVITVEKISWGTEIFITDSCGNYSEFVYQSSPFSIYSVPLDLFEEGKTYEVIFYKEIYFTEPQLGLLPLSEMGEWGAYPEDLSGIYYQEVE